MFVSFVNNFIPIIYYESSVFNDNFIVKYLVIQPALGCDVVTE